MVSLGIYDMILCERYDFDFMCLASYRFSNDFVLLLCDALNVEAATSQMHQAAPPVFQRMSQKCLERLRLAAFAKNAILGGGFKDFYF